MRPFSQQLEKVLDLVGGRTEDEKVAQLIAEFARAQLLETSASISRFEARYGMAFAEFSEWLKRQPEEVRYRHDMERTFMEWEGREASRRYWLNILKELATSMPQQGFAFQSGTAL